MRGGRNSGCGTFIEMILMFKLLSLQTFSLGSLFITKKDLKSLNTVILFQLVRNWTQEVSDYIIDEHYNERTASMEERTVESNCRLFQGSYLLSASALFNFNGLPGIGVMCNCPGVVIFLFF